MGDESVFGAASHLPNAFDIRRHATRASRRRRDVLCLMKLVLVLVTTTRRPRRSPRKSEERRRREITGMDIKEHAFSSIYRFFGSTSFYLRGPRTDFQL